MARLRGRKNLAITTVKPAPGDLRLVQDFVNTADYRRGTESLTRVQELADWLVERRLLAAGVQLSREHLSRALGIREGVRALLAVNNGAALDEAAMASLSRACAPVLFRLTFEPEGRCRFVAASPGVDDAFARLLEIVAVARIDGSLRRLKACAHEACRGAFYDFSTNRSARWCSMRRCGGQLKSRAYRRRQPSIEAPWASWMGPEGLRTGED